MKNRIRWHKHGAYLVATVDGQGFLSAGVYYSARHWRWFVTETGQAAPGPWAKSKGRGHAESQKLARRAVVACVRGLP